MTAPPSAMPPSLDAPDASAPRTSATLPLTRILATIGPASSSPEALTRIIEAGARMVRFNFSHGSMDDHLERLHLVREIERRVGRPIAVLGDLQGPKIRVGQVQDGGIDVPTGATVAFRRGEFTATGPEAGDSAASSAPSATGAPATPGGAPDASDEPMLAFASTYPQLVDDVSPGQRLLVNDGAVRMLVVGKTADELVCTVTHGGRITSRKGINLPDSDLSVATLTDRDREHAAWAVEHGLDLLALSFVRRADDIHDLHALLRSAGGGRRPIPIIAKIEVPQAIERIDEILEAATAMMVARGDLGVEMDTAEVPVLQRFLIERARYHGKPCIVATQMLESMIESPTPTRAEASDVATAIFEQVDATMLSGETAVGRWPALAVEQMRRITEHVEAWTRQRRQQSMAPAGLQASRHPTAALAHGVWTVAQDLQAACVVVWSETGSGALYLSRHDFGVPIIAVTSDHSAARRMQLLRGVLPVRIDVPESIAAFGSVVDRLLLARGLARRGDPIIIVAGEPLGAPRVTNRVAVHSVGFPDGAPVPVPVPPPGGAARLADADAGALADDRSRLR